MDWLDILKTIGIVLSGMATAIPLLVKLIEYVEKARREKNWSKMIGLLMSLMDDAEGMFDAGEDKKAWVLSGMESLSDTLDYDVDLEAVSKMIDELCTFSKRVNPPEDKEAEDE